MVPSHQSAETPLDPSARQQGRCCIRTESNGVEGVGLLYNLRPELGEVRWDSHC